MVTYAFTVHTVRPADIGAVEIVFLNEQEARDYARDRSSDFRVLATSVTRFTIGQLGTRWPLAWFVKGTEQPARDPGRVLPTRPTDTRLTDEPWMISASRLSGKGGLPGAVFA